MGMSSEAQQAAAEGAAPSSSTIDETGAAAHAAAPGPPGTPVKERQTSSGTDQPPWIATAHCSRSAEASGLVCMSDGFF
eukprot:2041392-Pleurochrysis_carterae.AAC.1